LDNFNDLDGLDFLMCRRPPRLWKTSCSLQKKSSDVVRPTYCPWTPWIDRLKLLKTLKIDKTCRWSMAFTLDTIQDLAESAAHHRFNLIQSDSIAQIVHHFALRSCKVLTMSAKTWRCDSRKSASDQSCRRDGRSGRLCWPNPKRVGNGLQTAQEMKSIEILGSMTTWHRHEKQWKLLGLRDWRGFGAKGQCGRLVNNNSVMRSSSE